MALKTRIKKLAKGIETAFFDIHYNGIRKYEYTGIKWLINPKTQQEKKDKQDKQKLVQLLANKREMELLKNEYDISEEFNLHIDFIHYMDLFIENHHIKEIKKFYAVRKKFIAFANRKELHCIEITETYLRRFVQYLEQRLKGESPSNYFAKLKQIIKSATADNHFRSNPAENIRVKKTQFLHKEVLNFKEIQILKKTPLGNENVKNAFLFSCLTGLRFCDIKVLEWKNVYDDRIKIIQEKTKIQITVPLGIDAVELLPNERKNNPLVFDLPSLDVKSQNRQTYLMALW
jgi:integrase